MTERTAKFKKLSHYLGKTLLVLLPVCVFSIILFFGLSSKKEAATLNTTEPLITILCYHHVDFPRPTPYSVSSAQLNSHIDALEKAGFSFISLKQLEDFYYKGTMVPSRSAVITFDDGNLNVYTAAYPLLQKRKIPFALFVYGITNLGHKKYCATWAEVREMADNGVIIGSHAYTHPYLTIPPAEVKTPAQYDKWLDREVVFSKQWIEQKIGRTVDYFAVPFGAFDSKAYDKIKKSGYKLSFNVHGMNNNGLSDPFNLNRFVVMWYDSPRSILAQALRRPIYFDMTYPNDLSRSIDAHPKVRFKLKNEAQYIKKSIQLRVSSFKWEPLYHNRDTDTFEEQLQLTKQHFYIASVKAKDISGNDCLGNWLFLYNKQWPSFFPTENIKAK